MAITTFDKDSIKQSITDKLIRYFGVSVEEATNQQIYRAMATTVRDQIMAKWKISKDKRKLIDYKMVYYLSVEFLIGRSLNCNLINLCSQEPYRQALQELNIDPLGVLPVEPEPALGNGGLGRLAACYLESMSTEGLPAMGCTLRYEYGFFRQKIVDGMQVELPENWNSSIPNVWEVARPEDSCTISFNGYVEEKEVNGRKVFETVDDYRIDAVPYDMPVAGYDNDCVNTLRLWSARAHEDVSMLALHSGAYSKAMEEKDIAASITRVLYPEDKQYEGKLLRLKQHYFFVSATLQYALRKYKERYGASWKQLPDRCTFQINDTHPGFAIPELMRLLIDQEGLGWEEAQDIVVRSMAYTNHTVMAEALERWPESMVKSTLPRIYMILEEINRRECEQLFKVYPNEWDRIARMAVLAYGQVHMANLCVAMSFSVNGVSQLHGDILKHDLFRDFYQVDQLKFGAITNGITHRRWLVSANPALTDLISEAIGTNFIRDAGELEKLLSFQNDAAFLEKLEKVKQQNKERFAAYIQKTQGITIDPAFIFDTQAKRLHEYKRQILNALHIQVLYNRIVNDANFTMQPHLFLFGAKAAPGYDIAKVTIRYINELAALIDRHPRARKMLKILFVENYNVSSAELLIPATEISQQLSTAGKEASGTGNMKFMMNGALTLGTMDGANVEMYEQVGDDHIYTFGMDARTVEDFYKVGNYSPMEIYERNPEIRRAMTQWLDGTLFPDETNVMQQLYQSLLSNSSGMSDPYFVLKDFGSYAHNFDLMMKDYADRKRWMKSSLINIAKSGFFSSDRAIREYNDQIWGITPVK